MNLLSRPFSGLERSTSMVLGLLLVALAGGWGCNNDTGSRLKATEFDDAGQSDAGMADGGDTDDVQSDTDGGMKDIPTADAPPVAIDTKLATKTTSVGQSVKVDCILKDEQGNEVRPSRDAGLTLLVAPSGSFQKVQDLKVTPGEVGDATVACKAPKLNLLDESPAALSVEPGPPHTVRTELDKNVVEAGISAMATCSVFDEWGNEIKDAKPSVQLDAMGAGLMVKDKKITIEKTGIYRVNCHLDGAEREIGASLEVRPALPASITLTPTPMRPVYGIGSVVRFRTVVTDRFGNTIRNAQVKYNVNPSAMPFGRARWEFNQEGKYLVVATVQGKTDGGMKLDAQQEIVVNGEGPSIKCTSPAPATVEDVKPGSPIKFSGTVDDAHGVQELKVNGQTVNVGSNGSFSTSYKTEFGINFVDIVAKDKFGEENSTTCAFLVANRWHRADKHMSDAITMRLDQTALDDGSSRGAPDSVADLLRHVVNSNEVERQIDSALRSQNPLKDSCDQYVDVWPVGKNCVHHSKITYRKSAIKGPHTVGMHWLNDGIWMRAKLRNLGLKLDIDSTFFNDRGWVRVEHITVELSSNVKLRNNRPKAWLRRVHRVDVGKVNLDFGGGLKGLLISAIESVFQNQMRGMIKSQIESYVKNNFNQVLDSLFSSIGIRSLGRSFPVDKLDGSGRVNVNFGVRFSSLDINKRSRALFGIGTKFGTRSTQRAGLGKGVPMQPGSIKLDPNTNRGVAVAIHGGVLNHVLYTLWRAGMFDAKLDQSLLGDSAPQGTEARLTLNLPPVVDLKGPGKVDVQLGGANLSLKYPGIFDKPVNIRVGLVARTGVKLVNGDDLQFLNINLTEFKFSPDGISLNDKSRSSIESFLKGLFQGVLDRSLNGSLPALPIPSFTIDRSIAKFGMQQYRGDELGLTGPSLGGTNRHLLLKGDFGIQ